ncbi:unnamed protein product [Hymenolepis diminuta]|uniref:Uncharacterized protein n=1 Tax=Hymenolepis diminuta TaxID=6216 RepID=A0A564YQH4_HYMDI|nr:unnamed protein product [Hymenolepis diminuta]
MELPKNHNNKIEIIQTGFKRTVVIRRHPRGVENAPKYFPLAGDSTSVREEEQHCLLEQAPVIQKKRARRKGNTQKPEVTIPPKMPQNKIYQAIPAPLNHARILSLTDSTFSILQTVCHVLQASMPAKTELSTKQILSHSPPSSEILP